MAEEPRQPRSIRIKPSILRKAHYVAIEEGKSLGQWIENTIKEKIERKEREKTAK